MTSFPASDAERDEAAEKLADAVASQSHSASRKRSMEVASATGVSNIA
ncbi:MAG: hypothetical protein JWM19_2240 [Actinomycetia bacterium]|nr:hypothetical protein [Actinomycetes bacterium]